MRWADVSPAAVARADFPPSVAARTTDRPDRQSNAMPPYTTLSQTRPAAVAGPCSDDPPVTDDIEQ